MRPEIQLAFQEQARACRQLGSPFTALVCELLAARLDASTQFGQRIDSWGERAVADALALRAAGALHGLARSGRCASLTALYPPACGPDALPSADALWAGVERALAEHEPSLRAYLDSPPQTNEVARSSVLLGAALLLAQRTGLPLSWHEIGASAGLNLAFDSYRYELGAASFGPPEADVVIRCAWEGKLPPLSAPLRVVERAGCDVNPLDPSVPAQRERLLSYVWPDQSERLQRATRAFAQAARSGQRVEAAPASQWLATRLGAAPQAGVTRVLAHTIVWQYLPRAERDAARAAILSAAQHATHAAPLAWFGMEADELRDGAGLRLRLWPGGESEQLGRADFHGRWVRWA